MQHLFSIARAAFGALSRIDISARAGYAGARNGP
jgi:hypothetical protein